MTPRGLTLQEAATLCGVTARSFQDWVRRGIVPGPWPGTCRYDRKALEHALDRLSGLPESAPKTALQRWREAEHARERGSSHARA